MTSCHQTLLQLSHYIIINNIIIQCHKAHKFIVFGSIFKRALTLYNTQQCRRSKGVYVIKFSDALSLLNNNNKKAGAWRASPLCCLRYHVLQVRGKKNKKFFRGRSHGLYFFFLSAGILFYVGKRESQAMIGAWLHVS